jgi:transposase
MRQLRQTLRLHLESGLSMRECSRVLGVSKTTVGDVVRMASAAGVDWAAAQTLDDEELEARLYGPAVRRSARHVEPNYAHIHQELKRSGVTLQLLWEEYRQGNDLAYKYTAFCIKYRAWAAGLKRSMRQIHVAGEKMFVDYAGPTVPIVDAATGEIRQAQIFVAVLGASNANCAFMR